MGHCWTPAHPTQDSPGTGTQKQLSWCPWGGTPSKGIPWPLYPTLPPQVSLFLPSLWLLLHLCIHPLCWLHCSSSPLVSKGSAIPSSCCVTHCLAGVTSLSCSLLSQSLATHGLLSQASSQSSVCISICISIFRLSYLDQKYAQQHEEFDRCV